jgi:hypothetical protein
VNRSERNRESQVEGALRRYEEDLAAAEARAVKHLQRVGFDFTNIAQAKQYQGKIRRLAQARADLIATTARVSG